MPTFKKLIDQYASIEAWREFALKQYDKLQKREKPVGADEVHEQLEKIQEREIDLTHLSTSQLLQFSDVLIQMAFDETDMGETGYKLGVWCALLFAPLTKKLEEHLHQLMKQHNTNIDVPNYTIMQVLYDIKMLAELSGKDPKAYSQAYSQYVDSHTSVLEQAKRNTETLTNQLTTLFQNSEQLSPCIQPYIAEKEKEWNGLVNTKQPAALFEHLQSLNLVSAIGDILTRYPQHADNLKTASDTLQNIAVLAEQIKTLAAEAPQKAYAIHVALTEVLMDRPDMTFDKLVTESLTNTDKNSPIGKLMDAMGAHRSLFWKIVNYFYPVDTSTLKVFKEKIQALKKQPPEANNAQNTTGQTEDHQSKLSRD